MSRKLLLAQFKVWANKRQYFKVFIFSNREAMEFFYRERAKAGKWGLPHRKPFAALTTSWDKKRVKAPPGQKGEIYFYLSTVGSNIVSHEMAHAAFALARNPDSIDEEWFCATQGMLVGRFWQQFWKRKLDKIKV